VKIVRLGIEVSHSELFDDI